MDVVWRVFGENAYRGKEDSSEEQEEGATSADYLVSVKLYHFEREDCV